MHPKVLALVVGLLAGDSYGYNRFGPMDRLPTGRYSWSRYVTPPPAVSLPVVAPPPVVLPPVITPPPVVLPSAVTPPPAEHHIAFKPIQTNNNQLVPGFKKPCIQRPNTTPPPQKEKKQNSIDTPITIKPDEPKVVDQSPTLNNPDDSKDANQPSSNKPGVSEKDNQPSTPSEVSDVSIIDIKLPPFTINNNIHVPPTPSASSGPTINITPHTPVVITDASTGITSVILPKGHNINVASYQENHQTKTNYTTSTIYTEPICIQKGAIIDCPKPLPTTDNEAIVSTAEIKPQSNPSQLNIPEKIHDPLPEPDNSGSQENKDITQPQEHKTENDDKGQSQLGGLDVDEEDPIVEDNDDDDEVEEHEDNKENEGGDKQGNEGDDKQEIEGDDEQETEGDDEQETKGDDEQETEGGDKQETEDNDKEGNNENKLDQPATDDTSKLNGQSENVIKDPSESKKTSFDIIPPETVVPKEEINTNNNLGQNKGIINIVEYEQNGNKEHDVARNSLDSDKGNISESSSNTTNTGELNQVEQEIKKSETPDQTHKDDNQQLTDAEQESQFEKEEELKDQHEEISESEAENDKDEHPEIDENEAENV